jgi:hypothetical protein
MQEVDRGGDFVTMVSDVSDTFAKRTDRHGKHILRTKDVALSGDLEDGVQLLDKFPLWLIRKKRDGHPGLKCIENIGLNT